MDTEMAQGHDRNTRLQPMVQELLAERQQMLVTFCRVAGLEPYTEDKPVAELLQEFCQILMDYSALGHFELFPQLQEGIDDDVDREASIARLYGQIAEMTQEAVLFNDRYDPDNHLPLDQLPGDLSRLGEALAQRIELEDRLLTELLSEESEEAETAV